MLLLIIIWPFLAFVAILLLVLLCLDTDLGTFLCSKKDNQFYKDKAVWITGASSGIGKSLAIALVKRGAKVIISARRKQKLESLRDDVLKPIASNPSDIRVIPMDVSDFDVVKKCGLEAWEAFGHVDILINNAGISQRSLAVDTDFDNVVIPIINVDLLGQIAVTQTILNKMVDRKTGQFINISSAAGKIGAPLRSAYCAAKWGLLGYFENIRTECTMFGIKVCNVCPGFISQTEVAQSALSKDGSNRGKADNENDGGVPSDRCAELILNAAAGNVGEVWIARGKGMLAMYVSQYIPTLARMLMPILHKKQYSKKLQEE